jgi:hypothetical protein
MTAPVALLPILYSLCIHCRKLLVSTQPLPHGCSALCCTPRSLLAPPSRTSTLSSNTKRPAPYSVKLSAQQQFSKLFYAVIAMPAKAWRQSDTMPIIQLPFTQPALLPLQTHQAHHLIPHTSSTPLVPEKPQRTPNSPTTMRYSHASSYCRSVRPRASSPPPRRARRKESDTEPEPRVELAERSEQRFWRVWRTIGGWMYGTLGVL